MTEPKSGIVLENDLDKKSSIQVAGKATLQAFHLHCSRH